jgi:hypothetical protein
MRNMIQLLGGVAVAGVVAAGSTAFTGAGASTALTGVNTPHLGGTITQTITGARLTGLTITNAVAGQITGFALTFADTPDGKTVALTADGTAGAGSPTFTCTDVSSLASTCTISASYKTNISTLSITVS